MAIRDFTGIGYLAAEPEPTSNPEYLSFRVGFHKKSKDQLTGEETTHTLWGRGVCSVKMIAAMRDQYVKGAKVAVSTSDLWARIKESQQGSKYIELSLNFVDRFVVLAEPASAANPPKSDSILNAFNNAAELNEMGNMSKTEAAKVKAWLLEEKHKGQLKHGKQSANDNAFGAHNLLNHDNEAPIPVD